jgi:hypothetical protein
MPCSLLQGTLQSLILKLPNRVKIQNAVYVCAMNYVVLYKLIATKTKCPRVLLAGDMIISGVGVFFTDIYFLSSGR